MPAPRPFPAFSSWPAWLALIGVGLLSTLAPVAAAPGLPKPGTIKEGRHFRITCYFDSPKVAAEALKIVESAWGPTVALVGRPKLRDKKIDVHLYRNAADYRAVEATITKGQFKRNNAFSSWDRKAAYVAVEPAYSDTLLGSLGLTTQTHRSLAHEAAHVIVYHAWANYRRHPRWLAEGIATWAADHALVPGGAIPALAQRPFASSRMVRLRRMAVESRLPKIRELLRGEEASLDFYDRYAIWWGFFRYLNSGSRKAAFAKVLAQVPKLGNGGAFRGALITAMLEAFGGRRGRFEETEAAFQRFAETQKGRWDEVYRTLSIRGTVWWQAAFAGNNAICWRSTPPNRTRYRIEGRLELLARESDRALAPQMNVLLGRRPGVGFLSVSFVENAGIVLWRYGSKVNRWERLGQHAGTSIRRDTQYAFAVHVDGAKVSVEIDGKRVLTREVEAVETKGPWGVGAQTGTTGRWYGVRMR